MRPTLPIGLALCLLGSALPAQERVVSPGGTTTTAPRPRQCDKHKIEMVDVRATGGTALPDDYRKHVAEETFFYFNPPEVKRPRYSVQQLVVHGDGRISGLKLVESSQNDYFDREVKRTIEEAARGGAFAPLPEGVGGDSLAIELSFGRHAGKTDSYRATRTSCPAWPKSSNPAPEYPREMREHAIRGLVRARFMVNVDGRIKPNTLTILQATNQQFVREVQAILPKLEYQPAEVQGKKVEQLTEQVFTFGIEFEPGRS
ncbi:MAG TPA: energy transducer TonB [Gemmatimonadaceae bacterium]|nr:energy transducer TonB [Gemmatimonadaceae bacterium]